jgi:hypothetical protein
LHFKFVTRRINRIFHVINEFDRPEQAKSNGKSEASEKSGNASALHRSLVDESFRNREQCQMSSGRDVAAKHLFYEARAAPPRSGKQSPSAAPRERPSFRPASTAVAALLDLQDEYRAWLDSLPTSLDGSRLAEKLQAIVELDLEELQAIDPPRGYGRD